MSLMSKNLIVCAIAAVCALPALAQNLPDGSLAVVNGKSISQSVLDLAVAEAVARGMADSPALRTTLLNDLVGAELLSQRARELGLNNSPDVAARLTLAQTNVLARELQRFWVEKNPPSQADMRAEYERQVAELNKRGELNEYELQHIVVAEEAKAIDLIKQINNGADFAALAETHSIDPRPAGNMGWVLPLNILPELSNVVVNLMPNKVAQAPVRTRLGWHVLLVKDKRKYAIPTFEASQQALTQSVQKAKWADYLKSLSDKAKIQR